VSVQLEEATEKLREMLLDGAFSPGKKVRENKVAERLGVSRTIARLAMSALEHEGLLTREQNRGSTLRAFTVSEIVDAIEVRGELEAMAARVTAERGLKEEALQSFQDAIARAENLLITGVNDEEHRRQWAKMNREFHETLILASGNLAIAVAVRQMMTLPLVPPEAMIFDVSHPDLNHTQLERSHVDHIRIVEAIRAGHGHRAESLVREHTFRGAQNKRLNLTDPMALERARKLPGGILIVPDQTRPARKRNRRSSPKS
jgi:GntR family transcriptional regulator of vanillate catabolism